MKPKATIQHNEMKIGITDTLNTGHVMFCNVIAENKDTVTIENGRKTYTMRFCKISGRHLDPLPWVLDCLILAQARVSG